MADFTSSESRPADDFRGPMPRLSDKAAWLVGNSVEPAEFASAMR